jgi:hypothetical protein
MPTILRERQRRWRDEKERKGRMMVMGESAAGRQRDSADVEKEQDE